MIPEKGKPKGALAMLLAEPDGEEKAPESGSGSSFKAVAKAFGIPPERQASAEAALKQYVMSCSSKDEMGSDDEEY